MFVILLLDLLLEGAFLKRDHHHTMQASDTIGWRIAENDNSKALKIAPKKYLLSHLKFRNSHLPHKTRKKTYLLVGNTSYVKYVNTKTYPRSSRL